MSGARLTCATDVREAPLQSHIPKAAEDALLLAATQSCLSPLCKMNLGLVLKWGANGTEGMTDGHEMSQSSVQTGLCKAEKIVRGRVDSFQWLHPFPFLPA